MSNYKPGTGKIDTSTPGPWKAVPKGEIYRGWHVVTADPALDELPVAEIWSTAYNEDKNARLIAAAPELMEMIEEFIDIIESSSIAGDCIAEVIIARDKLRYIETGKDALADYLEASQAIAVPPSAEPLTTAEEK